jgi:hypothetical protein
LTWSGRACVLRLKKCAHGGLSSMLPCQSSGFAKTGFQLALPVASLLQIDTVQAISDCARLSMTAGIVVQGQGLAEACLGPWWTTMMMTMRQSPRRGPQRLAWTLHPCPQAVSWVLGFGLYCRAAMSFLCRQARCWACVCVKSPSLDEHPLQQLLGAACACWLDVAYTGMSFSLQGVTRQGLQEGSEALQRGCAAAVGAY